LKPERNNKTVRRKPSCFTGNLTRFSGRFLYLGFFYFYDSAPLRRYICIRMGS